MLSAVNFTFALWKNRYGVGGGVGGRGRWLRLWSWGQALWVYDSFIFTV